MIRIHKAWPQKTKANLIGDGLAELVIKNKVVLIDESSIEKVELFRWTLHTAWKTGQSMYARTRSRVFADGERVRPILMHRMIMGFPLVQLDHRDRNGLNNTRANLRACTYLQNNGNVASQGGTSRYVGVYLDKPSGKWVANIRHNYKLQVIGYFVNEKIAAIARDEVAIKLRGEFAALNFPELFGRPIEESAASPRTIRTSQAGGC